MPSFEITKVDTEHRTWTAKKGPAAGQEFHSYTVTAKGTDGEVKDYEISRKPSSGPPPLGMVEADVQPSNGDFPDKLKLSFQGRSGGGSGGMDPERSRRIERQHSQGMAVQLMAAFEPVTDGRTAKAYLPVVKELTDWFQRDLDADGGGALTRATKEEGRGQTPSSGPDTATVSANGNTGFVSDKQKLFFERLLKDKGVETQQLAGIVRYVEADLPTDRVSKAIDALKEGDEATSDKAVEALLVQATQWGAKQTDLPVDDEGLPEV